MGISVLGLFEWCWYRAPSGFDSMCVRVRTGEHITRFVVAVRIQAHVVDALPLKW